MSSRLPADLGGCVDGRNAARRRQQHPLHLQDVGRSTAGWRGKHRTDGRREVMQAELPLQIVRGKRPVSDPLPEGVRQDIRWRSRHCLRPPEALVKAYLADPTETAWRRFERQYLAVLERRFAEDPAPFQELAKRAARQDVHLGCSCPTQKNRNVRHCHTVLALAFMKEKFPQLDVVFPETA